MLLLRRMYLGTCSAILGCFSRKTTTLNLGGGGWLSAQYGVFVKEYPRTSTSGRCRYVNCKGGLRTCEQEFASFATEHE